VARGSTVAPEVARIVASGQWLVARGSTAAIGVVALVARVVFAATESKSLTGKKQEFAMAAGSATSATSVTTQ